MIEVEAKVKISNPEKFKKKIKALARYKGSEKKVDDYYTLEPASRYPRKSLRIRKLNTHYQINFKQRGPYIKGVHAKRETEFTASDIKDFLALIKDFGFRKWLTKEKTTHLYRIQKNFHIELNHVKRLGWFLEIEYLAKPNQVKSARTQVQKILKKLEIPKKDIIKDGYTKMLWDKS